MYKLSFLLHFNKRTTKNKIPCFFRYRLFYTLRIHVAYTNIHDLLAKGNIMTEVSNSLQLTILRNKIHDLKKTREENLKKLNTIQKKEFALSEKINRLTEKVEDLQKNINKIIDKKNIKTINKFLSSSTSIPNRSIHIPYLCIRLKNIVSEDKIKELFAPIFTENWKNTSKKPKVSTTTYCRHPDYWEDNAKSIDFLISKENPKTKEVLHVNWCANYTKNKGNIKIEKSKIKLQNIHTLIHILQTNQEIIDFDLEKYPQFITSIVKKIQE